MYVGVYEIYLKYIIGMRQLNLGRASLILVLEVRNDAASVPKVNMQPHIYLYIYIHKHITNLGMRGSRPKIKTKTKLEFKFILDLNNNERV